MGPDLARLPVLDPAQPGIQVLSDPVTPRRRLYDSPPGSSSPALAGAGRLRGWQVASEVEVGLRPNFEVELEAQWQL